MPQLLNVLQGSMSLVALDRRCLLSWINTRRGTMRLQVKPGLTGL
ncbi:MAG: hypothetical protein DMG84_11860 [Acidobacteria bacterium]|nr:MAG: hypothetical protein DMG85_22200 [Acidobacteriota bacterium]PYX15409.1 MAG: hypothetical protein DMG84_11860 [Acidobacteriota bacterium]